MKYSTSVPHQASLPSSLFPQAIIGSIGDLDSPMAPDQKGFSSLIEHLMVRRKGG